MNSINTNDLQEMDLSKPEHKISAITTITKGKRFESYVGWSFAQALKSDKYLLGVKYNFSKEEERLYEIIKKLYLDINTRKTELEKVESKIKKLGKIHKNYQFIIQKKVVQVQAVQKVMNKIKVNQIKKSKEILTLLFQMLKKKIS